MWDLGRTKANSQSFPNPKSEHGPPPCMETEGFQRECGPSILTSGASVLGVSSSQPRGQRTFTFSGHLVLIWERGIELCL